MRGLSRDVAQIMRRIAGPEFGCNVQRNRAGHWKVTRPGHPKMVTVSHSPSDHHALRNIRSDLRRYLDVSI